MSILNKEDLDKLSKQTAFVARAAIDVVASICSSNQYTLLCPRCYCLFAALAVAVFDLVMRQYLLLIMKQTSEPTFVCFMSWK